MKNILSLIVLSFFLCTICTAQKGQEHRDKIREWRIAYITSNLELTEAEAEKFWPIYNAREKALREVKKEVRGLRNTTDLSEEEAEALILKHFEAKQKELDLNREFFGKLKAAIPATKIMLLPRVENEFKRTILEKMRGSGPRGEGHRKEGM